MVNPTARERIHNQTGLSRGEIVDRLNARYRATPVAPETYGDRLSEITRPQE